MTISKMYGTALRFFLLSVLFSAGVMAAEPQLTVVPGYQVCSVYLENCGNGENDTFPHELFYRRVGETQWETAYPLVYMQKEKQARGSLLGLAEDSEYELRLPFGNGGETGKLSERFRTLSVNVPIARTVEITAGTKFPLVIRESGSPQGYIRYTAKPGVVIDGGDEAEAAVLLDNCRYVILDGLTIRGGRRYGIKATDSSFFQIIRCDVSGFGRLGPLKLSPKVGAYRDMDGKAINYDGGITLIGGGPALVERNFVHDPRSTSTPWFYAHPCGPSAMYVYKIKQLAVRYNDFPGSDEHRWNDVIEGGGNGRNDGSAYRDAEIAGNYLAFGNDDGMELDGGQMNCRFFGNKSEGLLCGVSTAPCLLGPSYVYRNVFFADGDIFGFTNCAVKNMFSTIGDGRIHLVNNTMTGKGGGISFFGGREPEVSVRKDYFKLLSRNNVIATSGYSIMKELFRTRSDCDYDLMTSGLARLQTQFHQELHGMQAVPEFEDAGGANFRLTANSPGIGMGTAFPGVTGDTPFVGAVRPGGEADFPLRPVPFRTDRSKLDIAWRKGEEMKTALTVTVTKPGYQSKFRIRQNKSADFFTVTPGSGTLEYGKPLTLQITVNPAGIRNATEYKGAFMICLPDGFSRPVSVYVDAGKDPELLARDRRNAVYGTILPQTDGELKIEFDVPETGDYYLFTVMNPVPSRLKMQVNEGELEPRSPLGERFQEPCWVNIGTNVYSNFVNYPLRLERGKNMITLREFGGARITNAALASGPEVFLASPLGGLTGPKSR